LEVFNIKEAVVGLIFTLVLLSHDIFLPIIYAFLEIKSRYKFTLIHADSR